METFFAIIVLGILIFFIKNWYKILLIIAFSIFAVIVNRIQERKRVDRVVFAQIIGVKNIFEKQTEYDGYSVGFHGDDFSHMEHYRTQNVFVGRDVSFAVVYDDGKTGKITCREGSENYKTLMDKVK